MTASDQEIDQLIMSSASARWQKVVMVLARSLFRMESDGQTISFESLAARIEFLVHAGQIEGQGDISNWRHSEVRLAERGPVAG